MSDEPKTVQLPSRESVSAMQITSLLNMLTIVGNYSIHAQMSETEGGAQDGGVKCAVESTIINLCNRLDEVLAEHGRFDLSNQDSLENHLGDTYKMNTRMLLAQAIAYEEIISPHHKLKPHIVKLGPGNWLAFAGDINNLDNAICGMGAYPEQAIQAFDELFKGKLPEHLKEWAAACEAAAVAGQPVPEFTDYNKIKINEKQTLDERPPEPVKDVQKRRKAQLRNRKPAESNGAIGGEQNPL